MTSTDHGVIDHGVPLAELDADPYPVYARLRRTEPVTWLPEARQWLVTRWDDVHAVLSDPERFSTEQPESPMVGLCGGPPMLLREGPGHADVREAFRHDHDPHRVTDHVDTIARPAAQEAADDLVANGHADLAADYFERVATVSEATLLGIGAGGATTFRRWGNALAAVANNFGRDPGVEPAAAAALGQDVAVRAVVDLLRARPDGSLLSHMIHAHRAPGDARPDADVLPVLKHIAMSTIEPGWLAGWTLLALWSHPGQLAAVRADRSLLGAAVYEALRWAAPVGALGRRTTCAVTIGGTDIPADSVLAVAIASANRDESVFTEPDRFDVHRDVRTHLGFGIGTHECPAHPLVTSVARTALDVLLDRMPDVRPAPGWRAAPYGWKLRVPGPINAVWDSRS
jgi:cytochrome P450